MLAAGRGCLRRRSLLWGRRSIFRNQVRAVGSPFGVDQDLSPQHGYRAALSVARLAPDPEDPVADDTALGRRDQRRTPFLVFAGVAAFAGFPVFAGFVVFGVFATATARAAHSPSVTASSSTTIGTL